MTAVWSGRLIAAEELVSFDFRNRIPGVLDARVYIADGAAPLAGPNHCAPLYISFNGPESLAPISIPKAFATGTSAG